MCSVNPDWLSSHSSSYRMEEGNPARRNVELLAEKFQVTKAQISIKSGLSSKNKVIEIEE